MAQGLPPARKAQLIEATARLLATSAGQEPDMVVFQARLQSHMTPLGLVWETPTEEQATPIWHFYLPMAEQLLGKTQAAQS